MTAINPPVPESGLRETIVDRIRANAADHPERIALICEGEKLSWGGFDLSVNRIANLVLEMCGESRFRNVAILSPNSIPFALAFNGVLRAGGCVVPLSTMASPDALEKMLRDCDARGVFVAKAYLPLVAPFIASLDIARFAIDFDHPDFTRLDRALADVPDTDPLVPIKYEDPFNLIYSSGTTGTPKGIVQTHQMRTAQMDRVTPNGYDDNARTLLSTPLYSNTTLVSFFPTLYGGSTVHLMAKFDARTFLQIVERERITHTMLVPVQYKRIMEVADFDSFDLSSMRVKFSTSAPLRADVKRDVLARFPGKLMEFYGLTEGGGVCVLAAHDHPDKLHTVGKPAPGNEVRIIDDQGHVLAPGETGEIVGRGPTMMAGYYGREDLTRDYVWTSPEGLAFFRSGDMGRLDADGFLILSDRKKDMIISGGLNIYADDLERVLLADPDVTDAAVIGVPCARWGETPLGLVVARDGASAQDICLRANATLGKSQRLSAVEIRDSLPRSTIGKILKKDLRAPYWETEGVNI